LQVLGAQAGKTVCTWIDPKVRQQLVNVVTQNKALFSNPWFAQTLGLFPLCFADFVTTCDFSVTAQRYACRIRMNCEILIALMPIVASGAIVASGICAATGVGAIAVPDIIAIAATIGGVAAVALPLARAICENRPPNMSDLVALVTAMAQTLNVIGVKGIDTAVAGEMNKLLAAASKVPGDANAQVSALVDAGRKAATKLPTVATGATRVKTTVLGTFQMDAAVTRANTLAARLKSSSTTTTTAGKASPAVTTTPRSSSSSGLFVGGAVALVAALLLSH
jgi:hypothetical protein